MTSGGDSRSCRALVVPKPARHLRWDRIGLVVAPLLVLGFVLAHGVVDASHAPKAKAVAAVPGPDERRPRSASSLACPRPRSTPVRTAPTAARSRTVALTFDDGPSAWTPRVLSALRREGVPATFFMIGEVAAADPAAVEAVASAGHVIGDHSWSHPIPAPGHGWAAITLTSQLGRTQRTLESITGRAPCLFRPPGGVLSGARKPSRNAGVTIVLWSVDTRDWAGQHPADVARIRHRADAGLAQPHPVILLHDGGGYRGATLAALPGIIADYRSHGYSFVALDGIH